MSGKPPESSTCESWRVLFCLSFVSTSYARKTKLHCCIDIHEAYTLAVDVLPRGKSASRPGRNLGLAALGPACFRAILLQTGCPSPNWDLDVTRRGN